MLFFEFLILPWGNDLPSLYNSGPRRDPPTTCSLCAFPSSPNPPCRRSVLGPTVTSTVRKVYFPRGRKLFNQVTGLRSTVWAGLRRLLVEGRLLVLISYLTDVSGTLGLGTVSLAVPLASRLLLQLSRLWWLFGAGICRQ